MQRIGICLVLALVGGLGVITMTATGCGGGGGGGTPVAGPPVLSGPVFWCDTDNNGMVSPTDTFKLCFNTNLAIGANTPDVDLDEMPASLAASDTWTVGPGNTKLTLTLVGGMLTLGKVGGSTMTMAVGNTITNPVDGMSATPATGPFNIIGQVSNSGQNIGPASLSVALVDVDNDTDLDIVIGRAGSNLVFINNGVNTGTFSAGMPITNEPALASSNAICFGTLNTADTLLDMVACNGNGFSSIKYLNTLATPGLFVTDPAGAPPVNRSVMGAGVENATGCVISGTAAGANWDGLLGGDIFIGHAGTQNVVYFCNAAGQVNNDNTLAGTSPMFNVGAANSDTRAVVGGTLDAGATVDVVTADDNGNAAGTITVYLVTVGAPPTFVPAVLAGALANPRALALCDLDNDTDLDLIVGYGTDAGGPGGFQTFTNAGGAFALSGTFAAGENVRSVSCTHVDGDVLRDIVLGRGSNQGLQVYLNCGAFAFASAGLNLPGNFNGVAATPTTPATGAAALPQTGLNGNGLGDIATANGGGNNILYITGK